MIWCNLNLFASEKSTTFVCVNLFSQYSDATFYENFVNDMKKNENSCSITFTLSLQSDQTIFEFKLTLSLQRQQLKNETKKCECTHLNRRPIRNSKRWIMTAEPIEGADCVNVVVYTVLNIFRLSCENSFSTQAKKKKTSNATISRISTLVERTDFHRANQSFHHFSVLNAY